MTDEMAIVRKQNKGRWAQTYKQWDSFSYLIYLYLLGGAEQSRAERATHLRLRAMPMPNQPHHIKQKHFCPQPPHGKTPFTAYLVSTTPNPTSGEASSHPKQTSKTVLLIRTKSFQRKRLALALFCA